MTALYRDIASKGYRLIGGPLLYWVSIVFFIVVLLVAEKKRFRAQNDQALCLFFDVHVGMKF